MYLSINWNTLLPWALSCVVFIYKLGHLSPLGISAVLPAHVVAINNTMQYTASENKFSQVVNAFMKFRKICAYRENNPLAIRYGGQF